MGVPIFQLSFHHEEWLVKGKEHGKIYANFIGQIFSLDGVETDDTIFKSSRIHYGGKISWQNIAKFEF